MKKTLLLVFGGFVLILGLFAVFSYTMTQQLHDNHVRLLHIDRTAENMQKHKELMLEFSKHGSLFDSVAKFEQRYLKQSEEFYAEMQENCRMYMPENRKLVSDLVTNSSDDVNVLRTIAKLGFKEYGTLGAMRKSIHHVEQNYPQMETTVLLLRRHEKDFIMRLDDAYAIKHQSVFRELTQQFPSNRELVNYENRFVEAQLLFHSLYTDNSSQFNNWLTHIEEIQSDIRHSRTGLLQENSDISDYSLNLQLVLSSIVIVVLIFISYWFTRRFTKQVKTLQSAMSNFVESNYKDRYFDMPIPKNEIGQLTKRFFQMARKIETEVSYLEDRVQSRTQTLRNKNELLEHQHNEIVQSLNYAQNLQQSLLVSHRKICNQFKEAYIYYSPKNLVGGDFYWMREFKRGNSEMVLFALADCTGHGVPGALISVLGMNTLDELYTNGFTNPANLLNQLRMIISRRFNTENEQRLDGMDISIFLLNKRTGKLTFAGAQMPLWILRDSCIIELKGQRSPIGLSYGKVESFNNQAIQLESGDKILLFSDGLTDQFGKINQKKWGKKGLRKCLYLQGKSGTQQLFHAILNEFEQWKQNNDQTDDCSLLVLEFEHQKQRNTQVPHLIETEEKPLKAIG